MEPPKDFKNGFKDITLANKEKIKNFKDGSYCCMDTDLKLTYFIRKDGEKIYL